MRPRISKSDQFTFEHSKTMHFLICIRHKSNLTLPYVLITSLRDQLPWNFRTRLLNCAAKWIWPWTLLQKRFQFMYKTFSSRYCTEGSLGLEFGQIDVKITTQNSHFSKVQYIHLPPCITSINIPLFTLVTQLSK